MFSLARARTMSPASLHVRRSLTSLSAIQHPRLKSWIEKMAALTQPKEIVVAEGTEAEFKQLSEQLVAAGVMEPLDSKKRPNSFLARTDPADVARAEQSTYICSETEAEAGPTNNWVDPAKMRETLKSDFSGSMQGRTMYVIPFSMGPYGSPLSKIGVQLTDSPFVVLNMAMMTRMGSDALKTLKSDGEYVPCMHSVGRPLAPGDKDVVWPCNIPKRKIVQFPSTSEIWSFGSGYGGNSLLGKKCFALRIASTLGRKEGWLAEHMLILGITSPQNKTYYVAAAFPSACGKTNLAMLNPTLPGWKVECVGDDIAWMKFGQDGRLYAINPEFGFFGVAPGTSSKTNPNAMKTIEHDVIFTNVAKTEDNDVWWEGLTKEPPAGKITSWLGKEWTDRSAPAAHPNSRFTVRAHQCPTISPSYNDPKGVPISAIIFGGRRPRTVPLVYQSFDWKHGTFIGSSVASEKTAAAEGDLGALRFDPFAMLPFCGYNMGDYFSHWLNIGASADQSKLPKIFHVNWFRQDQGQFLWPGFGENSRVLKWIIERVEDKDIAVKTPIGYLPKPNTIDLNGLEISPKIMDDLLKVDKAEWLAEAGKIRKYLNQFGNRLPAGILHQLDQLESRLKA